MMVMIMNHFMMRKFLLVLEKVTMLIYRKYIAIKNVEHTLFVSFLWTLMQVWKRFTQFEQTFGDLASILKA